MPTTARREHPVPPPPPPPPPVAHMDAIILRMDEKTAGVLLAVMNRIAGSFDGPRGLMDEVKQALNKLGIAAPYWAEVESIVLPNGYSVPPASVQKFGDPWRSLDDRCLG